MNNSFLRFIGFISLFFLLTACSLRQETREVVAPGYAAPVLLPGTSPRMNTAGFWIGIHPDPDRIVIPADDIASFNQSIRNETGMVRDLTAYPFMVRGTRASKPLKNTLKFVKSKRYIRQDRTRTDTSSFSAIESRMAIPSIPSHIQVRFGLVTASTSQRLLPTDTGLHSGVKSTDIDRLQNSLLGIGTPLAVLHTTRDGRWLYAETPLSEGWVRSEHVGFVSRGELSAFLTRAPFFVTTSAKADVFLDETLRNHHAYVMMGCRFPSGNPGAGGPVAVVLPFRESDGSCTFKDAFIARSDVAPDYLPYTPRTIILQAFKLLHSPYGWGGMYGEQDCSQFIQQIFATVGIDLPRNSLQQARVGRLIAKFNGKSSEEKRLGVLSDNSIGGISILYMSGHIMLFLGNADGAPYAIHDMRGYSEPGPEGEFHRVVNRVVVTNLMIGDGTRSGPYLRRLVTVRAFEGGAS